VDPLLRSELMDRLNRDASAIALQFGLRFRAIEPERAHVRRRYGVCYADGTIRIRLAHAVTGEPLRYSSLVATLCHELAHLRHFNHGLRFRSFNQRILAWARQAGIYRPRSEAPAPRAAPRPAVPAERGPHQLGLFG
jgi:predicted metal-dependent hydrolase